MEITNDPLHGYGEPLSDEQIEQLEDGKMPIIEEVTPQDPVAETEEAKTEPEQEPVAEEPKTETEQIDFLANLREQGYEFNSEEELVSALKERSQFQTTVQEYEQSLNSYKEDEEVAALRAFRDEQGGSLKEYVELKYADYNSMTDDQLLWEQFRLENKENLKFYGEDVVKADFQEKLKAYTVERPEFVDDEEKAEWETNNKQRIELLQKRKAGDINKAKAELNSRKEKYAVLPTPTGKSDDAIQENQERFQANVTKALNDFQPVEISISDKKEEAFNLAVDDSVKQEVQSISQDPSLLLSKVGIKEDGDFDFEQMLKVVTLLTHAENGTLGQLLAEHTLAVRNSEIVERKLENPKDTKVATDHNTNESDLVAAARAWGL